MNKNIKVTHQSLNILTIALALPFLVCAQQTALPIGRVVYLQHTLTPGDQHYNGTATLFFSRSQSLYVHNSAPKSDSSFSTPSLFSATVAGDIDGFPILLDFQSNIAFCKIPCPRISKEHCIVRDSIEQIDWEIQPNQHKRFGAIICNLATGNFRGRIYEAWYAPEIPVPSGPFKLGNLPGLILEATSLDGKVKFSFIEAEIPTHDVIKPKMPSGKLLDMSYQAFLDERKNYFEKQVEFAKSKGIEMKVSFQDTIEIFPEK